MEDKALTQITKAQMALSKAIEVGELEPVKGVKQLNDIQSQAEAVKAYTKRINAGLGVQNQVAEIKIQAEREMGKLLARIVQRGGDRKSNSHDGSLKLSDLDISWNQSSRCQLMAEVPEEKVREYVVKQNEHDKEITSADILRIAKRGKPKPKKPKPEPDEEEDKKAGCIHAYMDAFNDYWGFLDLDDKKEVLEYLIKTVERMQRDIGGA